MSDRAVHLINSECEVTVMPCGDLVRIRITEKDPEIMNPTSFEIEGNAAFIADALATITTILYNLDELMGKEPN